MSLPPGFLDELRTRTSLAQVVGRKVMWDMRKSNQGKGDMWAPCPFHQEKTASFHVDDRKGYYYCFGCHAKGDAISFVRETENVDFMEAVEILARESGMQIPARDPQAREKADRRSELADVMEQAVQFFRLQMRTAIAAPAREYIERKRGLDAQAQERFEIGFAPDGWQNLWDHLRAKGVAEDLIIEAGLAKPSTRQGGKPYDTFRNRIIFPIRDPRGRCIAFGGRAMDPNDNAKYLNSPETLLFDKSHTLYNHGPAREAAGKGQPLIVAEGYMDVIALSEAGFGAAVAPLGTAITEHQIQLLWRIADEPIIALDGDRAGLGAAHRVIDLALPLLEAGKSLRFALMPEGKDPDDVLRQGGPGALQTLLDQAIPMVQLLWQRETEGRLFDSPERKAALDKALREKIKLIRDPSIRQHYGAAIKDMRWRLFNPRRPWTPKGKYSPVPQVQTGTKSSLLVAAGDAAQDHLREAVILAVLISHPDLAREFEGQIEAMHCLDPDHDALRNRMLRLLADDTPPGSEAMAAMLGEAALEKLFAQPHLTIIPALRRPGDIDLARMTVAEELAKLDANRGLQAEIAEAAEDLSGPANEALTWRLGQAAEAHNRAAHGTREDKTEFDLGDNGARIDRREKDAFDALLDKINYAKRQR
ncbi:DNA primase [Aquicoccus porphyridii]|uniref:DNA primase n=1 Tax=Aquicoccus porphyridii TaxID=1852029 RepID=A0A5A9ZHJ8_9RHOB|nr:DNA primase [Aquicoccus porphyridii]KAA0916727.1 DNA primase [Aquicoccus porphyridii]RAI53852.1 DNA primase [Rhodobacteraceae bacterium AsT-22]